MLPNPPKRAATPDPARSATESCRASGLPVPTNPRGRHPRPRCAARPESCTRGHPKSCTRGHPKSCARGHPQSCARGHPQSCMRGHPKSCTRGHLTHTWSCSVTRVVLAQPQPHGSHSPLHTVGEQQGSHSCHCRLLTHGELLACHPPTVDDATSLSFSFWSIAARTATQPLPSTHC